MTCGPKGKNHHAQEGKGADRHAGGKKTQVFFLVQKRERKRVRGILLPKEWRAFSSASGKRQPGNHIGVTGDKHIRLSCEGEKRVSGPEIKGEKEDISQSPPTFRWEKEKVHALIEGKREAQICAIPHKH